MVAINDVANMPFVARLGSGLDRFIEVMQKVPTKTWRMAIMAIALFWIVHSLANVFWSVMPSAKLPVPKVVPTSNKGVVSNSGPVRKIDIDDTIAMNLMGDFNAAPLDAPENVVVAPDDEVVPISKLNLKLQGIIAANDPKFSWAIIGPSEENQKLYKVGDELEEARGVKIVEIFDLKIRLNNNGSLEDLWLYGEDGTKVASSNYVPPTRSTAPDVLKATVSRDQIQQARNIGDVVRFMVATENGKMIGYKVRPGRKRELFDQVGLRTDDIVVSVNGIEVNEPQKVREVYQALKNATEANLQVMRDGTTHSIQISMSSEG